MILRAAFDRERAVHLVEVVGRHRTVKRLTSGNLHAVGTPKAVKVSSKTARGWGRSRAPSKFGSLCSRIKFWPSQMPMCRRNRATGRSGTCPCPSRFVFVIVAASLVVPAVDDGVTDAFAPHIDAAAHHLVVAGRGRGKSRAHRCGGQCGRFPRQNHRGARARHGRMPWPERRARPPCFSRWERWRTFPRRKKIVRETKARHRNRLNRAASRW